MHPEDLKKMPDDIARIFMNMENRVMADIIARIKENAMSPATSDWQIRRLIVLGESSDYIKKQIQKALEASDEEIERILSDEVYKEYTTYDRPYQITGVPRRTFEENEELQQLVKATTEQISQEYHNLANSAGFAIKGENGKTVYSPVMNFYRETLDAAVIDVKSGMYSYQQVLNRTVKAMSMSGLRWIDYASGHHNRIDVAARRAILTGFRQIQGKINEQIAAELGTNHYEVDWHTGARPDHMTWQGKVYSREELESVCGLGDITGLCGANCYHNYEPFIKGVSQRRYSDEWLEAQNKKELEPKEYNGKGYTTYEALQKQRRMETQMRADRQNIKLLKDGGATKEQLDQAKAKYRGHRQQYNDFAEKMNLPNDMKRVYQDGLGRVS